jgi:nucleoside-diphosphate-sugar epimerase
MKTLVTGSTGLTGSLFLAKIAEKSPFTKLTCLVRSRSSTSLIDPLKLQISYCMGDSAVPETWDNLLHENVFDTIIHIVQLRQIPVILEALKRANQRPHLIIIGTTGVFSKYNTYSAEYKDAESCLEQYQGTICLLRPTMIYGSHQDKNIHKLIRFCNSYKFFPVFGSGNNLLQPVHTDDLAQALLYAFEHPEIQGEYNLSGGTVVTLNELIFLVSKVLGKPVRAIHAPLNLGIGLATVAEKILKRRSPVKREQILRLQEDKAYSNSIACEKLNFSPRSLEDGLRQEVTLLKLNNII